MSASSFSHSARSVIANTKRRGEQTDAHREDDDADGRAAFGLGPTDAAAVILDAEGRVAMKRVGAFPLFERDRVADVLGVEFDDKSPIERPSK